MYPSSAQGNEAFMEFLHFLCANSGNSQSSALPTVPTCYTALDLSESQVQKVNTYMLGQPLRKWVISHSHIDQLFPVLGRQW